MRYIKQVSVFRCTGLIGQTFRPGIEVKVMFNDMEQTQTLI